MVTILAFIGSFQVFDIINVTTQGGPGRATTVLVFRVYKEAFTYGPDGLRRFHRLCPFPPLS